MTRGSWPAAFTVLLVLKNNVTGAFNEGGGDLGHSMRAGVLCTMLYGVLCALLQPPLGPHCEQKDSTGKDPVWETLPDACVPALISLDH